MEKYDKLSSDLLYIWSCISDKPFHTLHCHAEHEIYYFIQGDIEYQIEGHRYTMVPESLLLIPPNCFHGVTIKSNNLHRRVSIHFQPGLLEEADRSLLLKPFYTKRRYYPNLSKVQIGFLIQSLLDCKTMELSLQRTALKYRTIALLTHIHQIQPRNMISSMPVDERIQSVLWYLNSNLTNAISLEQIAEEIRLSKNHLNVLFRQETGTTIHQYIRMKRLTLARQAMRGGCNAEEAAYKAGFNDYSTFYRAYKFVFSTTPSDRADKWQEVHQPRG
jgi:AraC-like DNA-binding protein